jgi:biotin operon repressor/ribosomal protein S14
VTRAEKIAEAHRLRKRGWTYQRIGDRFGVSHAAVWKWLHPELVVELNRRDDPDRTRRRRWEGSGKGRGTCDRCGGPKGIGCYRYSLCRQCYADQNAERVHERGLRIVQWWAEGQTRAEIAAQLGWGTNHLSVELDRLRKAGYDLPKRPPGGLRGRSQRVMEQAA